MKNEITLKVIAKRLGISVSTVSRALQNHHKIGIKTKEQVKQLAEDLHYEPNLLAKWLKSKNSQIIGVIIPDLKFHFFSRILSGIESSLSEYGYQILIAVSNESEQKELEVIKTLVKSKVDGLIIISTANNAKSKILDFIDTIEVPVVFVDRAITNHDTIYSDDELGAGLVADYLYSQKCKTVGVIKANTGIENANQRLHGFFASWRSHHQSVMENLIVDTDLSKSGNIKALEKLISESQNLEGIFCYNDYVAFDVINHLKKIDFEKNIIVCGYGNEPIANWSVPKITTVEQFPEQLGGRACNLLLKKIGKDIGIDLKIPSPILVLH